VNYPLITAWAIDFMRAAYMRGLLARLMFRVVMGKHAYREFIGLRDAIAKEVPLDIGYDLTRMDYHGEKVPLDFRSRR
jgi:hypothetical protein